MTQHADDWCSASEASSPATPRGLHPPLLGTQCQVTMVRWMITGLLRDLLIRHFASPAALGHPILRDLQWRPDKTTAILINSYTRYDPKNSGLIPSLAIKPNRWQSRRYALNDLVEVTSEGHEVFGRLWTGGHTVFCEHGTGEGTEILAAEVAGILQAFAPLVRDTLYLQDLAVTSIEDPGYNEESARHQIIVPIVVGYEIGHDWKLVEESPWLRRVMIDSSCGWSLG